MKSPKNIADQAALQEQKIREKIIAELKEATDLCALAGHPEMVAPFFRQGLSPDQMRHTLQDMRADEADAQDIDSHIPMDVLNGIPSGDAHGWESLLNKAAAGQFSPPPQGRARRRS